jgi:CRP-like cAMP-binding protein
MGQLVSKKDVVHPLVINPRKDSTATYTNPGAATDIHLNNLENGTLHQDMTTYHQENSNNIKSFAVKIFSNTTHQSDSQAIEDEALTLVGGGASTRRTSHTSNYGLQILVAPRNKDKDDNLDSMRTEDFPTSPGDQGSISSLAGALGGSGVTVTVGGPYPEGNRRQSLTGSVITAYQSETTTNPTTIITAAPVNPSPNSKLAQPTHSFGALGGLVGFGIGNNGVRSLTNTPSSNQELSPMEVISGFGWGGESEAEKALEFSHSRNSLPIPATEQCFSPMGSIDLVKEESVTILAERSAGHLPQGEAYTAEDIIDSVKSKYEDEAYSIEEFTASAAFGVQLNVDHPLTSSGSKNLLVGHSPSSSHDRVQSSDEKRNSSSSNSSSSTRSTTNYTERIFSDSEERPRSSTGEDEQHHSGRPSYTNYNQKAGGWSWTPLKHNSNMGSQLQEQSQSADRLPKENKQHTVRSHTAATILLGNDQQQQNHAPPYQPSIVTSNSPSLTRYTNNNESSAISTNTNINANLQPPPTLSLPTSTPAPTSLTDAETEALKRELPQFEREIKKRMYPEYYRAGQYIIRKHEIGKEMYFLSKGKVEVVSGDGRTVYSVINRGSFFGKNFNLSHLYTADNNCTIINEMGGFFLLLVCIGELGVLFNVPRTASIRAVVDCFCMVLTREQLEDVLKDFPHIAERFRTVAEQRMKEVKRKISYRRRMEVKSRMDVVAEVPEDTIIED